MYQFFGLSTGLLPIAIQSKPQLLGNDCSPFSQHVRPPQCFLGRFAVSMRAECGDFVVGDFITPSALQYFFQALKVKLLKFLAVSSMETSFCAVR